MSSKVVLGYSSFVLQATALVSAVIASAIATTTLKFGNNYCALYITSYSLADSPHCETVKGLFAAAAVLSALILGILIFTVIYQLSKTKTVYFTIWIVAFIAAALSFIGACLLEVGIRDSAKVLANEDALFKFIQTFGKDASLVKTAVGAGWYTTCAWGVYLLIEVVSYFRFGVDLPGKSGSVNAMRKA